MKSRKIIVEFDSEDILAGETLICDVFFETGLKGVICNTPIEKEDIAPTDLFDAIGNSRQNQTSIVGYLPDVSESDVLVENINQKLDSLKKLGISTNVVVEIIDDNDWAHAWKDHFHVTRITDKIVVRPSWKPFEPKPSDLVIDLDPGMAFGTGTHPTTFMCIELIEQFLSPGQDVLDVGTGSGILLIAASLLGASRLTGIDIDHIAVDVCKENLIKNQIDNSHFQLYASDIAQLKPENQTFDLVVSNILPHVLIDIMKDLVKRTKPGGVIILSGIVKEKLVDVETSMKHAGLITIETKFKEEWVGIAAMLPEV